MASIPGGPSDKLGNEFERLWTIWQLIEVVAGRAVSVTIEALGDDERGTEFWVAKPDGTREGHQCKRENGSRGDWSVADLQAKKVITNAKSQLDRNPGHRFCFVSGDKAPLLGDLVERASRGDSPSVFCQHAIATSRDLRREFETLCRNLELNPDDAGDQAAAQAFLRRCRVILKDRNHLRDEVELLVAAWFTGEPNDVVSKLESFISRNENMGRALREGHVVGALPAGTRLRDLRKDTTLSSVLTGLQERFERSYRHLLIDGRPLGRPEAEHLYLRLQADDGPRLILVHGAGGDGKTGVVFELVGKLLAGGIACLPLRLDRDKPANTPTAFGGELGCPASPVACLAAVAGEGTGVLILDQIDAIRWTTAHSAHAWDTCERLINESLSCPQLRVVVVCRSFDVEDDPRIRAWKSQRQGWVTELKIGELNEPTVRAVVTSSGVAWGSLTAEQQRILRSAKSLYLWRSLVDDERRAPSFVTTTDLMDAFWQMIRRRLSSEMKAGVYDAVLDELVRYMDACGHPSAPRATVSGWPEEVAALISLHVLTEDRGRVLFAHQSYLDYLTAERLLRNISRGNTSVSDWLRKGEQSLFRRGQLRQLLELMRDQDSGHYMECLEDLITAPGVRFHLRHLALLVLSQSNPVIDAEADLVVSLLADQSWLEHIFVEVLVGKPAWFDVLRQRNVLATWLEGEDPRKQGYALHAIRSVVQMRGEAIAAVLVRGRYRPVRMRAVLAFADPSTLTEPLFRAYLALVIRWGKEVMHIDWKGLVGRSPERAMRVLKELASHAASAVERCLRSQGNDVREDHVHPRTEDDLNAMCLAAGTIPVATWHMLLPLLRRLSSSHGSAGTFAGMPYTARGRVRVYVDLLQRLLEVAGRSLAQSSPSELERLLGCLGTSEPRQVHCALAESLLEAPSDWYDYAIQWLFASAERLTCGRPVHSHWKGPQAYRPAYHLLRRYGTLCRSRTILDIETVLLSHRPVEEAEDFRYRHGLLMRNLRDGAAEYMEPRRLFLGQYLLLSALPRERLSPQGRDWLGVLERKFEYLGPVESLVVDSAESHGGRLTSPLPHNRLHLLSDRDWLRIISRKWSQTGCRHWRVGPNSYAEATPQRFSSDLSTMARRDPARFAQLALQFSPEVDGCYPTAIISALDQTDPPQGADVAEWRPAPVTLIEPVVDRFAVLLDTSDFAHAFCRMIRQRPDEPWSDTTLLRLAHLARCHPDPKPGEYHVRHSVRDKTIGKDQMEPDVVSSSLACLRGAAADALAAVLYDHLHRLDLLLPTIHSLAHDEHVSVRIAATSLAIPLINADRQRAADLFVQLCDHPDDNVLLAPEVDRFLSYMLLEHLQRLRPIVERMISSQIESVAGRGAGWATEIWTHAALARDLVDQCVGGNETQREEVARNLSHAISQGRGGPSAVQLLVSLFGDGSKDVRGMAASVFRYEAFWRTPNAVLVIHSFVGSPAFLENVDDLLYGIHSVTAPLSTFATAIRGMVQRLISEATANGDVRSAHLIDGRLLAEVLLRLYEQSDDSEAIRKMCLDAWDSLLEQHIGYGLLNQLDR